METQEQNLNFLNDIKSFLNSWEKIKCFIFNIRASKTNCDEEYIIEISVVEIKNFKLTGNMYHAYVKAFSPFLEDIPLLNEIDKNNYGHFERFNDSENQLQNLLNFIGDNSYLIVYDIPTYKFLMNELNYWNSIHIQKERFRCIAHIANKLFKKEKKNYRFSRKDFLEYYNISDYPEINYFKK